MAAKAIGQAPCPDPNCGRQAIVRLDINEKAFLFCPGANDPVKPCGGRMWFGATTTREFKKAYAAAQRQAVTKTEEEPIEETQDEKENEDVRAPDAEDAGDAGDDGEESLIIIE